MEIDEERWIERRKERKTGGREEGCQEERKKEKQKGCKEDRRKEGRKEKY